MPSSLPPQLVMTWLPIRDVAAALCVSKDWFGASEPLFQAIAGRHGLRRLEPSWRYTVEYYRATLGLTLRGIDLRGMELIASAASDDVPAIQRCISEGVNPNFRTSAGQRALHIAAMWGHLDALNALIAAGADLNAQNHIRNDYGSDHLWGGTPLHVAANSRKASLYKRYLCAQRLIEAGANARLLNDEEDAPHQSQFPEADPREGIDFLDQAAAAPVVDQAEAEAEAEAYRLMFRKLLKDAYRAQR